MSAANEVGAKLEAEYSGNAGVTILVTGVHPPDRVAPRTFALHQNYPNPFNPTTEIEFSVLRVARVELAVFDVLGRKIRTLTARRYAAGTYRVKWDGRDEAARPVPSGVYFYRMKAGTRIWTRKMVLMR